MPDAVVLPDSNAGRALTRSSDKVEIGDLTRSEPAVQELLQLAEEELAS